MIYFDNAATGGFKPRAVTDATESVIRFLNSNPARSSHRLALTGAKIIGECRETLASFFNSPMEKVIFTKNCTEALNLAIFGTLKVGGHVITTVFEHNSVLRPLYALKNKNLIELDVISPDNKTPLELLIKNKIKPNTYLIITTAVSNVTGYALPVKNIGKIAKENNLLYLVDGAQAGGHILLDLKEDNINMLSLAGHKGLYGIMGSGVLIFDENTEIEPLIYGGTGTESFNLNQTLPYPEKLEAGTLNLPAISALNEGVKYVKNNVKSFGAHLYSATETLIENIKNINNVVCYSLPNESGICAFKLKNLPSAEVCDILNSNYDIAVRGGFHCAPLMHKFLKTDDEGLVRVSLAVQNSTNELNYFISSLKKISAP